jgi:hypothetical protein
MREMRNIYKILFGKLKERNRYLGHLGIDGRMTSKWILRKRNNV